MFASAVAVDPSRTQHAALDAAAAAGHGVRAQAYADGCGWALDEDKFKNFDTMTVNNRVTLNSLDIPRATALGAFVNEQLRGLTEDPITPPFGPFQGKLIHTIKIYGLPGEKIEYRLCTGLFFSRVFNDVRNNRSFAHDNDVVDADEARLIFETVVAILRFVESRTPK